MNPVPVTEMVVPGGPLVGVIVTVTAAAANDGVERHRTSKTRTNTLRPLFRSTQSEETNAVTTIYIPELLF